MNKLEEARRQLGPFNFENLPLDRNDSIWAELRSPPYSLDLEELSALKNARCTHQLHRKVDVRGILLGKRIASGIPFTSLLPLPRSFKIPITSDYFVNMFSAIFELGMAEYTQSILLRVYHEQIQSYYLYITQLRQLQANPTNGCDYAHCPQLQSRFFPFVDDKTYHRKLEMFGSGSIGRDTHHSGTTIKGG